MMKFKYIGQDGCVDMDLIEKGILNQKDKLKNGQEIEIEDDHELIPRLQNTGAWEQIQEDSTPTPSVTENTEPDTEVTE